MKSAAELKQTIIAAVDRNRAELLRLADRLLHTPENGYMEFKTAELVKNELVRLGLRPQTGLAVTGLRADIESGRPGPKIAIMGELDALPVPTHPFADPVTGVAHACGHYAELVMMLGAAAALPRTMDKKTYLEYKEQMSSTEEYHYDQA